MTEKEIKDVKNRIRQLAAAQRPSTGSNSLWRKKPVVIEAVLWTGSNRDDLNVLGTFNEGAIRRRDGGLPIRTLEGEMIAMPGDWIIKGVKGELYPCKPDIFAATYEPADLPQPADLAQRPTKREPDDRPIPTYGQIPWDQLGRDVMDAMYAVRSDYQFDESYYPGHQMVPQINFNSLARIVDKYRWHGINAPAYTAPDRDAIYRAIESNVHSEPDKHFVDRRWMVGINDAVDAILALSSTDREGK